MSGSRFLTLCLIVVLVGSTAGTVSASPAIEVRPFCPVCQDVSESDAVTFETALAERVSAPNPVERSTLEVRLFPNGSVVWTAQNTLSSPALATRLAENATLRQSILDSISFGSSPVYEPQNLTLQIDDDTARIHFIDPDGARQGLGGILFLTAHETSEDVNWMINADRMTIIGPPGWETALTPEDRFDDFRTENGSIVWQRDAAQNIPIGSISPSETYAFAPRNDVGAALFTHAYQVLGSAWPATGFFFKYVSVPAIAFFYGLVYLGRGLRSRLSAGKSMALRRQYRAILGLGLLVSAASVLYLPLLALGLLYLVVGVSGYVIVTEDRAGPPRLFAGIALFGIIVPVACLLFLYGSETLEFAQRDLITFTYGLAVVAFTLPLGALWQSRSRFRYVATGLLVAIYSLLLIAQGAPSFRVAQDWIAISMAFGAATICFLAGVPLTYFGASVSHSTSELSSKSEET